MEIYITENLTNAELTVLELLKQGYSYSECAEKTFTSYSTIKTHVNAIFQKKKVNSLQELLVLELTGKVKDTSAADSPPEIKGFASPANAALNLLKHLI